MSLYELKAKRDAIERNVAYYTEQLNNIPRNEIGMIPDDQRETPFYKENKAGFDKWFSKLQAFNSQLTAKQKRALRDIAREEKCKTV